MLKIMTVIGTRPEAIKVAPVIKELIKYPATIKPVICATAQHRGMLDQMLRVFDLTLDYDLNLMKPNQGLAQLTADILIALDQIIAREAPDWVLVQGDTTTAMAASLSAYYRRVQVGHIEAGLRTGDKFQPFPEEINRRIADVLADLYFAPTEANRAQLVREGVPSAAIVVTGNTVIDALLMTAQRVGAGEEDSRLPNLEGKRMILVTAHRRENFGVPLANICAALKELALRYVDDVHIVYPVHLNPNVSPIVHESLGGVPNISLLEPVDYATLVTLMMRAHFILTDSGGLQEEAPSLHKPVLVLRQVTERNEVVAMGAARLVGTDRETIVRESIRLLEEPAAYQQMISGTNPYGDGNASQRIVQAILAREKSKRDALT